MNAIRALWFRLAIYCISCEIDTADRCVLAARASIKDLSETRDRLSLQLYAIEQDLPA